MHDEITTFRPTLSDTKLETLEKKLTVALEALEYYAISEGVFSRAQEALNRIGKIVNGS